MSSTSVPNQLKGAGETATWDEGCQRLAALIAVERSQRDRGAIDALASKAWHERAQRVAAQLRFSPADRQWPKLFNEPNASLAEVSREMAALGDELRRAAGTTGSGVAP